MTPERWQRVDELFHSALAFEPALRAAFLAQACGGDQPLLREVTSLISFHEDPASFMETPASDIAAELLTNSSNQLEVGQQIAHYLILSLLGAGGMGEVYLAEDTRLGRRIALKLLPAQFTSNAERVSRFEQEARAASALNHPNIVTIHEIGRADSTHFIATEFIDGETLREHISGRAVRLNEVLDIGIQVAAALSAAHAAVIVHRDIKPENVMIRPDCIVKVLDFGLAKLALPSVPPVDPEAQIQSMVKTNPGVVMGTVRYMSPEQARAEDVDARTDIWSLGVLLYEMVTGRVPFEGETPSHVIVSILESEPPPLASYSEVPLEFERIVAKALRKDRELRYEAASELAVDLKSLKQELEVEARLKWSLQPDGDRRGIKTRSRGQTAVATLNESATRNADVPRVRSTSSAEYLVSEIKRHKRVAALAVAAVVIAVVAYLFYRVRGGEAIESVAVLPFVNESADPNTEYLSDGISDSIINSLSRLPNLNVKSLNTVLRYKGRKVEPQTVGRELNVRAVLIGRLRRQEDRLVISAELVDVRDNRHLWGEQYDRKVLDLLVLQGEIARKISDGLRLRLSGEEKKQLAKQYTENPEAYQFYILGRHYYSQNTKQTFEKSIGYYEQAIEKDPNYALAYTALANTCLYMASRGFSNSKEVEQKGERAALRALELDETLAEAHAWLGMAKFINYEWAESQKAIKRALELDPDSYFANVAYFQYLSTVGRPDEALSYAIHAQELDPAFMPGSLAYAYFLARRYDKAIDLYRQAREKKPNEVQTLVLLGETYVARGMYKEGVAEMQKAIALDNAPERWDRHPMLAYAYAMAGRRDEALKILNEQKRLAKQAPISPYNFVIIYTGLGDKDRAFEWLQKGFEQRTRLIYRLKSRPMFDSLRSDPRYAELLRKMGLEP